MTPDEILRAAVECQLITTGNRDGLYADALVRFATLVRNAALEEAAGACENTLAQHYMKQVIPDRDEALLLAACADCAAAIRQLKETK